MLLYESADVDFKELVSVSGTSKVFVALAFVAGVVAAMFGFACFALNDKIKDAKLHDPTSVITWQDSFNASVMVALIAAGVAVVCMTIAALANE